MKTPQCRSGSYSRSLRSDRSGLILFRLGWLPGLLIGLLPRPPTEFATILEDWPVERVDSRGDLGDAVGTPVLLGCCSAAVARCLTGVWLLLILLLLLALVPLFETDSCPEDWLFLSFDNLQ